MSWYYGTFSCGCAGRTNVCGPEKNRQWIADNRFSGLCPECYEKKLIADREIANKEAEEKAKEMELPELQGSEKQIAWANTLRQQIIENFEKTILIKRKSGGIYSRSIEKIDEVDADVEKGKYEKIDSSMILQYILTSNVKASWYIDRRNELIEDIAKEIIEKMKKDA